jgi:hypothetical protein
VKDLFLGDRKHKRSSALIIMHGVCLAFICQDFAVAQGFPPPTVHQEFEELDENPYFEADRDDPRILHPAPGAAERGIDRGYVEKMSRPAISPEILDQLDDVRGRTVKPLVRPDTSLQKAVALNGNILIIEGDEGATLNTPSGIVFDHGGGGLEVVINRVWSVLGDEYDFITVFSTYTDASVAAYYMPLQQDTVGLGECNFNAGRTFGCIFSQLGPSAKLQGFIYMNSIQNWRNWDQQYDGQFHSFDSFDASVFAVLGQETAHRWGAGFRFLNDSTGALSTDLLGRDFSHWAAWVDTNASVLDGWAWAENDDGTFKLVDDMNAFWTLDLYAMGALAVNDTEPFFYIDNARFIANSFVNNQPIPAEAALVVPSVALMADNGVTLEATGTRKDLTIADVADAEGVRCPDSDHAQRAYRQLFVLVTRPGETVNQVANDLAQLEEIRLTWEKWWLDRTRKIITLCTSPEQLCIHPWVVLSGGNIDDNGQDLQPGTSFSYAIKAYAYDTDLEEANIEFQISGEHASLLTVSTDQVALDTILAEDVKTAEVEISIGSDYPCGEEVLLTALLTSSNAENHETERRIYPGYETLFHADFDDGEEEFTVSGSAGTGAFEQVLLETSCFMSHRSPSRDHSSGGLGAFVTGQESELDGESILTSPSIDLEGNVGSTIRFSYWLRGSGQLTLSLSNEDDDWKEAVAFESDSDFDEWRTMAVDIESILGPNVETVALRFNAVGEGSFEVGIDEILVMHPSGSCVSKTPTEDEGFGDSCSCDHLRSGATGNLSPAAMAFGLLFCLLRRRPNGNA